MECRKCRFWYREGYEYPEYSCQFFGDIIPDEVVRKDYEGCKIPYKSLEKLEKLNHRCMKYLYGYEESEKEMVKKCHKDYKDYLQKVLSKYKKTIKEYKGE